MVQKSQGQPFWMVFETSRFFMVGLLLVHSYPAAGIGRNIRNGPSSLDFHGFHIWRLVPIQDPGDHLLRIVISGGVRLTSLESWIDRSDQKAPQDVNGNHGTH